MAKLLIINPMSDTFGRHSIPTTLISALLKENNHQVELFDTTFMNTYYLYHRNYPTEELNKRLFFFKDIKDSDCKRFNLEVQNVDVIKLFEQKLNDYNPDFIAFSFWGSHLHAEGEYHAYFYALKIIELADTRDIPIVVGGTVPTSNTAEVLKHPKINCVVRGEGELVYLDIANRIDSGESLSGINNLWIDMGNGRIEKNELRDLIDPLDELPFADFDIYDDRTFYRPYHGKMYRCVDYELSRGCVYNCTFCLSPFQRKVYQSPKNFRREKSIAKIIDEIRYLKDRYKLDIIRYQDETFLSMKTEKLKELSLAYKKHVDLPFIVEATINSISEEKIQYMKRMGCLSISFGLESGSEYLRDKLIRKPKFDNEKAIENLSLLKKAGMGFTLFSIIGFPEETREMIFETIDINYKIKPPYCQVIYFQPWEGTALRAHSIDYGLLDTASTGLDNPLDNFMDSPLRNLPVSKEELNHLHDAFTYYVYINKLFWPLIRHVGKGNSFSRLISFLLTLYLRIRLKFAD